MSNNLKQYGLETKENFILYLKQLIISTKQELDILKRYNNELENLIHENNFDKEIKK